MLFIHSLVVVSMRCGQVLVAPGRKFGWFADRNWGLEGFQHPGKEFRFFSERWKKPF